MRLWEQFLQSLEKDIGKDIVERWLKPLKVVRFDARNLYLEAKDHFQALWFEEHIRAKAQKALINTNNRPIKIHLNLQTTTPAPLVDKKKEHPVKADAFSLRFDPLNPHMTFDSFVESEDNRVAYRLLLELKIKKILEFNPIYLFGKGGTGKTHLLTAAAFAAQREGMEVIYTTANTFTDHVVAAIRSGEMSYFRKTYRNVDLLIIDDVHNFSKRGATQEELFHTFNTLHLAGKQIILSADCCPLELEAIEPRLISRFEWGITLPIKNASTETLEKILEQKLTHYNFPLTQKVTQHLLAHFKKNAHSVSKAVDALVLRSHTRMKNISSTNLTLVQVNTLLEDLLQAEETAALSHDHVLDAIGQYFHLDPKDLLGKSQQKEIVLPRQLTMYLFRQYLALPYIKIGDILKRDHSTVMSSIKKIEELIKKRDKEVLMHLSSLTSQLEV